MVMLVAKDQERVTQLENVLTDTATAGMTIPPAKN
jgi:hypothetical protein